MSIDDGIFGLPSPWFAPQADPGPGQSSWGAFPGDWHTEGANLSFADGHAEHHRWLFHRTIQSYSAGKTPTVNAADFADVRWLQERLPHRP